MKTKPELSIVILNYNTQDLLRDCLNSLNKVRSEASFEIIVSDNGSTDGSVEMLKRDFNSVKVVENKKNLGFAAGNNRAKAYCQGKFVLFLNSDTKVKKNTLRESLAYLEKNEEIGALGCKIVLPNGDLDKDSRRSFPSPWVSLTHFSGLDRIFPKSPLLAKYWYGYIDEDITHEVDVLQGAFLLVYKKILDQLNWFDEDYFLDGEDIDLCWRIKEKNWKIVYYPKVSIIHLKGATKGKNKSAKSRVPLSEKVRFRMAGVNSMEIFYKKRLWKKYPLLLNFAVLMGIRLLKIMRLIKLLMS